MSSLESSPPSGERDVIDFVSRVTDAARLRIEENLPFGFVRLKVAEAERRQAQHDIRSVEDIVTELVRNSRDAGAKRVMVAFQKEQGRYRKLTVIDDGRGIPVEMHDLVFEPRVTSKSEDFEEDRFGVHGRGMALF
ncbi:MAG: ATP-binding protein, partial [Candidatus Geothermincolia bacterium]